MQSLYVTNWFPPSGRAKANSAWLLGLMVGPMFAIPLITHVIVNHGWRASFWMLAVLSVVPLVLIWFHATDHPRQSARVGQAELKLIEDALQAEREGRRRAGRAQPQRPERLALLADRAGFFVLVQHVLGHDGVAAVVPEQGARLRAQGSAFVPTIVGWLIGRSGNDQMGLMFLVGAGLLGGRRSD